MKEILYVKVEQNIDVYNRQMTLKDVAKLYSTNKEMVQKLEKAPFYAIPNDAPKKNMFSILKVYEAIHRLYPDVEIQNLGELDFIVEYRDTPEKKRSLQYWKAAFVCLIVFFGAAFTIMTFNEDVNVAKVFDKLYEFVMGQKKSGASVIEVAYAIGLPIGILIFYNHFRRKEVQNDPTPIQVEMRNYEEQINKAMIKTAGREGKSIDAN